MPSSDVEIANLALSHIGIGHEIADIDNEDSEEAAAVRRFLPTAREATLMDFAWPFATKFVALGLVANPPTETDEWQFSYRYPSDCLRIRRILSGLRQDYRQTRVPYKIGQDSQGLLVYTDQSDAKIEYTLRAEDPSRYPADFVRALSWRLASEVAPRLARSGILQVTQLATQMYRNELTIAVAGAENEEQVDLYPESELIRERGDGSGDARVWRDAGS